MFYRVSLSSVFYVYIVIWAELPEINLMMMMMMMIVMVPRSVFLIRVI